MAVRKTRIAESVANVPAGLELGLRNYWHPVLKSEEVTTTPLAIRYLGEDLVAWRDYSGKPHVFADYCPHRGIPLSVGTVVGNNLQCIFHGLQYAGDGRCAFMPWEPDDSPQLSKVRVPSCPVEELHGLVFAYIGEAERFAAPPLRDELPAELFDPDYPGYILTHIWNCNWLLAVDQADRFHVPFLHAQVATRASGNGAVSATHGGDGRRIKVMKTKTGVLDVAVFDPASNPIYTGQRADPNFQFEGFYLPAFNCLSIAEQGMQPHHIYMWLVPIDESHTRVTRIVVRKATTPEERERWERDFREIVGPRTMRVSEEDNFVASAAKSLEFARTHEHLFMPDSEIYRRRLSLKKAFLAMQRGKRYPATRLPIVDERTAPRS